MTATEREARIESARKHIAKFENMADVDFIRAAIRHARYLDTQSREIAREALKRFDRLVSTSPAVTVTEGMVSDLRRTQQLAELALESCRYDRLQSGHGDIGRNRGTDIGLWDEEVNQRDRSRACIKAIEAALKSPTPQAAGREE